jgi:acetyltransferase-like isoleucine patch superfamily enzyme
MNLPPYVSVGRGTYFADLLFFRWGNEKITIGNYCSISRQVRILAGGGHKTDAVSTFPFDTMLLGKSGGTLSDRSYSSKGGIEIGSDVWIGFGATIAGSVKIGHGAVIASNATVLTDVPPYAIAVGNPARVTKYRFSEEAVKELLEIKWWEWAEEEIKWRVDDFYLPVGEFIEKCRIKVNRKGQGQTLCA